MAAFAAVAVHAEELMKPIYTVPGELAMLTKEGHVQGATCSEKAVYLSCSGGIMKLDWDTGRLLASCPAKMHLGDIAFHKGKIYGAYGLFEPPPGKSPLMVGVWDADTLEPLGEWHYDFPGARYLDGAVVVDDVLYVGVEHYGEGRYGHPPHRDCTVMLISVADMKAIGTKEVEFDYPIHFGVQDLGTDGENLLFGNYGALRDEGNARGLNFSRVTRDFKLLDSRSFPASEGFCLVPRSRSRRDAPVYFTVVALGGNMQGWWKDRVGNPARVRLDFFEYDRATGAMRDVTDRSAGGGYHETLFIADDRPCSIDAEDWKEGLPKWPGVTIPVPSCYRDFRGYDRLAVDFVAEPGTRGDPLQCYIAGPEGHVAKGAYYRLDGVPEDGYRRWVIPLDEIDRTPGVSRANVARVNFFLTMPRATKLRFYRVTLLAKGVECPPPSEGFIKKVIDPLLGRRYGQRGLAAPAVKTEADIIKAQDALEEHDRATARRKTAKTFREHCRAKGQRGGMCVGAATSMEKHRPRDGGLPQPAETFAVRLARGETEALQVLVMPDGRDLRNVRVCVSPLRSGNGDMFPASNVTVSVLGYVNVTRKPPYRLGRCQKTDAPPYYRRVEEEWRGGWYPDPILSYLNHADIAGDDLQGFWVSVRSARDQPPGVYRGVLRVCADGARDETFPFAVRVNAFAVPRESPLPLAITCGGASASPLDGSRDAEAEAWKINHDPLSPVCQRRGRAREWCDFYADHYLTWDDLYHAADAFPNFEMLRRQRDNGTLSRFNLGYWKVPEEGEEGKRKWRESTLARYRRMYARAKELGIADRAYAYGCDEANPDTFERVRWAADEIRRALPGVRLMTTARDGAYGVGSALSAIDDFVPVTERFDRGKAEAARKAGHGVWWYFACDQKAPCANSFVEGQGIEMRSVMGAQAVKFRPDGFLYYYITLWNARRPITGGPFTDWNPRSWTSYHGDGSWVCCGPEGMPLSTVRLENFRDGLEDFAYARMLERKLSANPTAPWADEARSLLAVPDTLVESVRNFSDDPQELYRWRDRMADLLEL